MNTQPVEQASGADFNLKLVEGFNKWLTVGKLSRNTGLTYSNFVKQFATFIGDLDLREIKRVHVSHWLEYLTDHRGVSSTSAATALFALRKFYDFLNLGDVCRSCAPRMIPTRKIPKRLPQALNESQIKELLRGARKPRDLAIIELFYASGVRCNELRMLNVEDVYFDADLTGGSVTVHHGKGDKERIVLIGKFAARALKTYLDARVSGPLFLSQPQIQQGGITRDQWGTWRGWWRETNGKGERVMRTIRLGDYELPTKEAARRALKRIIEKQPGLRQQTLPGRLSTKSLWRIITTAARRAGLGDVHPHQLRHSFATHLINHGADILYVSHLLGHATVSVTARYIHIAIEELIRTHHKFHPRGE